MQALSVVVPTCRRPDALARCLQTVGAAAEVIVSDDSRDRATESMVEERFPHVRYTRGPQRGPAANRNHGARLATHDWLVFVDDDCEPSHGWLEAIARATPDADVVEGKIVCPDKRDTPFEVHVENLTGGVLWSGNLAIRRTLFERLGGFDEDFREAGGEDMEFAWRLARAGARIDFVPDAAVVHLARQLTWRMFWRRIWMIRWMVLYRLKTGASPPPGSSALRVVSALLSAETLTLLRLTLHLLTRPDRSRPKAQRFDVACRWLMFPAVLPWQLGWEFRFRRRLTARCRV